MQIFEYFLFDVDLIIITILVIYILIYTKMKIVIKVFKTVLRVIFGFIILLFLNWLLKFNGSFGQYVSFLNNKNWSISIKNINLIHPKSIFEIFLETEQKNVLTWNENNLVNTSSWDLLTWNVNWSWDVNWSWISDSWSIDVYDPSFQQWFDEYFEGWNTAWISWDNNSSSDEWFGFKKQ